MAQKPKASARAAKSKVTQTPNEEPVELDARGKPRKNETLSKSSARGRRRLEEAAAKQRSKVLADADDDEDDLARDSIDSLRPDSVANHLWKLVRNGRPRKVQSAEELWEKACEYFQWVADNPLYEGKVFSTQKGIRKAAVPKMRAMTLEGLCLFLGISRETWDNWCKGEWVGGAEQSFLDVCKHINFVIREQKFSGAAADLLNANLISRDLGLSDRQELSGPDGGPLEVSAREILIDRLSRIAKASED